MAQNAATPDENLRLSQSSRQGDETKISSGVSRSRRGVDLIETLQYSHNFLVGACTGLFCFHFHPKEAKRSLFDIGKLGLSD